MELFHASQQWATRPSDQRFASLDDMFAATRAYADQAAEAASPWNELRVEAAGTEVLLSGRTGIPAKLTHHSFGQLAARAGAPANYLRALPATLAAQNLNHGLKAKSDATAANLLFHSNGGLMLRAATSEKYSRIWNYEVIDRLRDAAARFNLVPARPTFRFDDQDPNEVGDLYGDKRPALFASDHDMFAFLHTSDRVVVDPVGQPLYRGVIVSNTEVGGISLKVMGFLFRDICGNFIIWGAKEIAEIRLAHIGDIRSRWAGAVVNIRQYLDGAESLERAAFKDTVLPIAGTKEEVLDLVFAKSSLSRKTLESGYGAVVEAEDGSPNSRWGLVQGLTRYSQQTPYADERTEIDRQAGKILKIAF